MVDDAEAGRRRRRPRTRRRETESKTRTPYKDVGKKGPCESPSSGATVKCGRYNNISQANAVGSSFCMGCVPIGWRPVNGDRATMVKKESAHTMHAK